MGMSARHQVQASEYPRIVVTKTARMNLDNQFVIQAHCRHFCEHLGAKQFAFFRVAGARSDFLIELGCRIRVEICCRRSRVTVVRGRATKALNSDLLCRNAER